MAEEPMFIMYRDYYGSDTYADEFVLSALDGTGEWQGAENVARGEGTKKGAAYLNTWQYVIHEMEDAVNDCNKGNVSDNDAGAHAWDEAVAFYVGSLEGETLTSSSSGVQMFNLAHKRCGNFNTCNSDGVAKVNEEILALFKDGQQ